MSTPDARKTWNRHYHARIKAVVKKLGRIATLDQIVKELASQADGVVAGSVRKACEAFCVNGTGRHNLFHRDDYDEGYHFLLKVAPGVYAMPDPKYLDLAAVFNARRQYNSAAK